MKKLIASVLVCLLTLSLLAGCGTEKPADTGSGALPADTPAAVDSVPPTAPAVSTADAVRAALVGAAFGDRVTFGAWEQDGDEKNGAEPISWLVVKQGVGQALLVSEYCLENMPYHAAKTVTWEHSDLRAWLNGAFWNAAFTEEEKACIALTHSKLDYVDNYEPGSCEVDDRVLLLTYDDANRYLSNSGALAYGILTAHAAQDDPYLTEVSGVEGVTKARDFWLLDSGQDTELAAIMEAYTGLAYRSGGFVDDRYGVRPAVWFVYDEALKQGYESGTAPAPADAELDRKLAAAKLGDVISFGAYDANYGNAGNWSEMKWKVVDEADGSILLLAEQLVYALPYMNESVTECSWDSSDLRATLNSDAYLNSLFTPQERDKLCLATIQTEGSADWDRPGCESEDYLFIPGREDLSAYVSESPELWALQETTYWLRNPDFVFGNMAFVYSSGGFGAEEPHRYHPLRLMAWIKR